MDSVAIRNISGRQLRIVLEPLGDSFDVETGEQVELRGKARRGGAVMQVDVNPDNCISLWVAEDVHAYRHGEQMRSL